MDRRWTSCTSWRRDGDVVDADVVAGYILTVLENMILAGLIEFRELHGPIWHGRLFLHCREWNQFIMVQLKKTNVTLNWKLHSKADQKIWRKKHTETQLVVVVVNDHKI
jgi:hypothetical protein